MIAFVHFLSPSTWILVQYLQVCHDYMLSNSDLGYLVFMTTIQPGCWYVLSPTRKETSYSDETLTFASLSKTIQNIFRPTRSPRQQWPRRKKTDQLSFFFSRVALRTYQHSCILFNPAVDKKSLYTENNSTVNSVLSAIE